MLKLLVAALFLFASYAGTTQENIASQAPRTSPRAEAALGGSGGWAGDIAA
ncbi:hypothetical protein [Hymenobacter sp.]|uniref:hypothetical protein n=1 Tax=Hymenobacter sp. TaxID=1898978 RepID=UPI00286C2CAA|nr:hypothetical protein [Hymenobacter sp.]